MQRRLYFAFLGVLLAITVVSAAINVATGRPFFGPRRGGPRMAEYVGRMIPAEGPLDPMIDEIHDALGMDLTVVDLNGKIVADAGAPIPVPDTDTLARAARGSTFLPQRILGGPLRYRPGLLVLIRTPVPSTAYLRPLLLLAAVLLVSFALVYPLSRSITRPIEQLTDVAYAYGRGDLARRSGLGHLKDEVGKLARTFDEMADRIQVARAAEKELLANVSHELRTPLARIKFTVELIEPANDTVRRRLASVSEEVDELDRLVGDLLTAARLEVAALPLRKTRLVAKDLVEKARDRSLGLAPDFAVQVRAEDGLTLEADEALLSRALDNLLDNARKYGKAPAEVEVRREDGQIVFAVQDRGEGIPTEELGQVFDPFFRGGKTRAAASGFGLGLALVKRVAEGHGGSARAANADGGGARVELRIPATVSAQGSLGA